MIKRLVLSLPLLAALAALGAATACRTSSLTDSLGAVRAARAGLRVTVRDAETHRVVEGVVVQVLRDSVPLAQLRTQLDSRVAEGGGKAGIVVLDDLEPGTVFVYTRRLGYDIHVQRVRLRDGKLTEIQVPLRVAVTINVYDLVRRTPPPLAPDPP